MEKTKVEQALDLIFREGSLLRDGTDFVGFLEHRYVFGYHYEDSLVVRSIDNYDEWLLDYVKSRFSTVDANEKPDIRKVWHEFYGTGIQITYGKLPWDWSTQ